MNGVKGLLIKEFYLRRKILLTASVTFLLVMILAVSVCLSLDYGNLAGNESFTRKDAAMLAYVVAGTAMIVSGMNGETIVKDIKCHWNVFEYTLPLAPQKLAGIRIGIICCGSLAGLGIAALCSRIIYALAHRQYTLAVFKNISVIALIIFIMMVTVNILFLKYKDPQRAANRFVLIFILLYSAAGGAVFLYSSKIEKQFRELSEDELNEVFKEKLLAPAAELRDALFPYMILIFAAVAAIGYFFFVKYIKRREK